MVNQKKIKVFLLTGFLVLLALVLVKCGFPDSYSGISWNVGFHVPLMNKVYPIFDLEDGENIIIEDDQIYLVYNEDLESSDVSHELKINPKSSAVTQITSIETGTEVNIQIEDSEDIDLIYGEIEDGVFQIEVLYPRPELQELNITFLDIVDGEGNPYVTVIDEFETSIHSYDIAGYYVGDIEGETVMDELRFLVQTTSDGMFDDLVYLRMFYDEVITFSYFRGYMNNKEIELFDDQVNNNVNMPVNISNALHFEEAILELSFTNELGFDAQFIGTFTGRNEKDNREYSLLITEADNVFFDRAEEIGHPTTTSVMIDKPELADLISAIPQYIIIEDSKFILGNCDESPGFASSSDKNTGNFSMIISSVLSISNETIVPDTVHTIDITKDNRDNIEEYLDAVFLEIILENSLPVGAAVDIYFSESPDTLHIFNPGSDSSIHTIKFSDNSVSAAVSEAEPTIEEVHLSMDREDIELFLNETVYFATKITFEESDGTVTIRPDQYLGVLGRLKIDMLFDFD